ncbi:MAG: ABC transporter substrate-binding protein [Planctomycetota bacterium]|jgi:iron complex transport system substrate-binding protein
MNKWWWLLLIASLWAAAGFAIFGLQPGPNTGAAPLPSKVSRIVSTAPSLTEILFALGLDDKIVGVSNDSDYPPEAAKKKKVGTFWQLNIEAIIAAKPDLVVTLGFNQQKNLAERLSRMGYNGLTLKIRKISELFDAIAKIGSATNADVRAESLVSDMKEKLQDLSALAASKRVRVLFVVQREPLRVAGRDTFVNEMIELAGGENAIGPTLHKYPPIGAEQVIACAADVIIEPTMTAEDVIKQRQKAIQYWSRFKNVPAVKNSRIYVIDGDAVSRLGPRICEGTQAIAKCLRPELFAE